jgi:TonB family protein
MKSRFLLPLLGLMVLELPAPAAEDLFSGIPAEPRKCDLPLYPVRAQLEGLFRGEVEVLLDIDAEGRVIDSLVLQSTHRYFSEAVERAVRDWSFQPARRADEPVPMIKTVRFHFELGKFVNASFGPSVTFAYLESIRPDRGPTRMVARLSELDALPKPVEIARPLVDPDLPRPRREGRTVFQFFIDESGKVRMPVLIELEGDIRLAEAANTALEQWRFETPRSRGRAVIAHARQEFIFHGGE